MAHWKRDLIARIKMAMGNQLALSFPEVNGRWIQVFEPGMSVPVRIRNSQRALFSVDGFVSTGNGCAPSP
jgi:hypothetical protein